MPDAEVRLVCCALCRLLAQKVQQLGTAIMGSYSFDHFAPRNGFCEAALKSAEHSTARALNTRCRGAGGRLRCDGNEAPALFCSRQYEYGVLKIQFPGINC